jgi:hypothetical protein
LGRNDIGPDPAKARSFDELLLMSRRPGSDNDGKGDGNSNSNRKDSKKDEKDEKDDKKKTKANGRAPAKRRKSTSAAAVALADEEQKAKALEEENETFEAKFVNAEDAVSERCAFTKQVTTALTDALVAQQRAGSAVFELLQNGQHASCLFGFVDLPGSSCCRCCFYATSCRW